MVFNKSIILCSLTSAFLFVTRCDGWKAIPANQAAYSLRTKASSESQSSSEEDLTDDGRNKKDLYLSLDMKLPRNTLHSVYKFGWCRPDAIRPQFLRNRIRMTFATWQETKVNYVYCFEIRGIQYVYCSVPKSYHGYLQALSPGLKHHQYKLPTALIDLYEFNHVFIRMAMGILNEFSLCHDDFTLRPADGLLKKTTFTWLGFAQYIHVTTGLPHHSKAPRVLLIQKQFVIGTAADLLHLPKNYKLGNVVFGDYERDEVECGLVKTQIKMGIKCPPAYIEMPLLDITPHPEYSRFGVGNSLALVKLLRPLKSEYVIPICLPSVGERVRKRKNKFVFMVDYISTVPKDFDSERMGKKTLKLYTHKECRRHRMKSRLGSEGVTHVLCSSGCGVRAGAPIVSHASAGPFELIGVVAGGAPCSRRSMRRRLNDEPPLYIDVYPYTTWIINVITAYLLPRPFPQTFRLTSGGASMGINKGYLRRRKKMKEGWRGRNYVSGNFCFKPTQQQISARVVSFYVEKFEVNADPPAKLNLIMKISAGIETTIVCARLKLPNRLVVPRITGVGGYNITLEFNTEWFPWTFYFALELVGKNSTRMDMYEWFFERKRTYTLPLQWQVPGDPNNEPDDEYV